MTILGKTLAVILLAATGATAQAGLAGTWQSVDTDEDGTTTSVLDLRQDGSIRLTSLGLMTNLTDDDTGTDLFPDGISLSFAGNGTWTADGERLRIELGDSRLLLDGEDFDQGLLHIAQALSQAMVEEMELTQEEYDAFEALIFQSLWEGLNEDAMLAQIVGDLNAGTPYRFDGETLVLTDGDGVEAAWSRHVSSAVQAQTWAGVKTLAR